VGLHDDVIDAELIDEAHHFLLRARGDRKHRHHGPYAEDHTEHGQ